MKTAVKVSLTALFAVGFCVWFIWFIGNKPAFMVKEIELCSATREFVQVRPDEMPEVDSQATNLAAFCKFSYTQGFKTIARNESGTVVSLAGVTPDGMKVGIDIKCYGYAFYELGGYVFKSTIVEVYYQKKTDGLFLLTMIGMSVAGTIGWGLGCLFVRLR